jgi:predicted dehydrogenase
VDEVRKRFPQVAIASDPHAAATAPDIDLVVIASPNDSHCPLASAALRAGKHVVIDKPFSITLEEARETVALAKQCGRILSIFHNRRWDSEYLATKDILSSGVLGKVTHQESHIDRFRPNVRKRWREEAGPGSGLWFDLGPHLIDQALQLLGLPEGITGRIVTHRPGGQTDDWAHILLHYPGVEVVLHASMLVAGGSPRCILHGTQGSWYKFGADVQEPQMIAGMMPGDPGFGVDSDPGIFYNSEGQRNELPVPAADQSLYYVGIRDAILNGVTPPVTAVQGLAVQAVLEASFQSSKEGRTLPVPLTEEERSAFTYSGY